jgi:hypothetical protein
VITDDSFSSLIPSINRFKNTWPAEILQAFSKAAPARRKLCWQVGDAPQSVTVNNQANVMVMSDERLRELQAMRQRVIQQQKGG